MTEETHEAPNIEVLEYTEMEDGSAVVVVNISMEAAKLVLQVGLQKLFSDLAESTEKELEPSVEG